MKFVTFIASALALSGLLMAPIAQAQQPHGEYYDYVIKVNVGDDGYLYVNVAGNFSPNHGCSQPGYVRSDYTLSDDRTRAWLQMSLASFLSKKKVYVETTGCTNYGYPIMTKLQLEQP
jgi:hypothetical protein